MKIEDRILYEDQEILVCHKPAGIATQTGRIGQKDLVSYINNYLAKKQSDKSTSTLIHVIHRLDQPVEGILVFAKTKKAAGELTRQITSNYMEKRYYALFSGQKKFTEATIADYLLHDQKSNTSHIVTKDTAGAKKALLEYSLKYYDEKEQIGLAEIHLITGRHHQIRVQMAGAGMGLLGDQKYASDDCKEKSKRIGINQIGLCAYRLAFSHPTTHKDMVFEIIPESAWYKHISN